MNESSTAAAVGAQLRFVAPWLLWPVMIFALVYTGINIGTATWGTLDSSGWESLGWVLPWLGLGAGISNATSLPVLVAHGLSRRTAAVASGVVTVGLAIGGALVMQVGLSVESAAFRAAGLSYVLDDPHLFHEIGQSHLIFTEYLLLLAAFIVTGWLMTVGYYRFGGRRGVIAMPLAALPALGTVAALAGGWVGELADGAPGWIGDLDQPVALALALVPVVAGLAAMPALARTVPVRNP
jgi:hypothetical protein